MRVQIFYKALKNMHNSTQPNPIGLVSTHVMGWSFST